MRRGAASELADDRQPTAAPARAPEVAASRAGALPAVALVGRANVGKSTLFNRLCRRRDALVADHPGLTRDRRYGRATLADRAVTLIDTGGLDAAPPPATASADASDLATAVSAQVAEALSEAQAAVLVVDARDGAAGADEDIARHLRRRGLATVVAVNKIDGAGAAPTAEFAHLGLDAVGVSAKQGRGIGALAVALAGRLPSATAPATPAARSGLIETAVVGRPNVGKSTLVNHLLGAERQVVSELPGTTRDAIDIPCGDHLLIDTAGIRRKGRSALAVEKFSVVKTLAALDRATVALLVVDALEGIVDQDLHILGHALDAGAGVLLAANKCDRLSAAQLRQAKAAIERRLGFAPWVPVVAIAAATGRGVAGLLPAAARIHHAGAFDVKTSDLNRILTAAVRDNPPPAVRSRRIKLRYAHKAGAHPPALTVHGSQAEALPASYLRYLANRYRKDLELTGVPIRIATESTPNPFAGRRNVLTARQRRRRQRVIRHEGR